MDSESRTRSQLLILWPVLLASLALWYPLLALIGLIFTLMSEFGQEMLETYGKGFDNDHIWWALLPAGLLLGLFIARHPAPPDDLLQSMVAWAYHYDYRLMFWGSPRVPGYDQYWGWDRLVGLAYQWTPGAYKEYAPLWIQIPGMIFFLWGLQKALAGKLENNPLKWTLIGVATVWCFYTPIVTRATEARPEWFFAIWTIWAFALTKRWQQAIWLVTGILLIPCYWLAWAYAPAFLALQNQSLRRRMAGTVLYGGVTLGIWLILSHGTYLASLHGLQVDIAHRVYGVAEDYGLSFFLQLPAMAFLIGAFLLGPWDWRRTKLVTVLLLGWFCLPWMVRYVDILAPLALFLLAEGWQPQRIPENRYRRLRMAGFVCFCILPQSAIAPGPRLDLKVPHAEQHPKVLTPLTSASYALTYDNPGIRIAPAMEPGMTRRSLQKLAGTLKTATCAQLQSSHADYIMANDIDQAKPCLRSVETDNGWTLWKILERRRP